GKILETRRGFPFKFPAAVDKFSPLHFNQGVAMYSVIISGGFQHKVTPGERVKLSRLNAPVGEVPTVTDVLLFANGADVKVGLPKVEGAVVKLEVLQHDRGDKIRVFKRKRRKRYRKTQGHRQRFTEVIVREISCDGATAVAEEVVV